MKYQKWLFIPGLLVILLVACSTSDNASEITTSSLNNYEVVDQANNRLGEVEEILHDSQSGQILYVIVALERSAFDYSKAAFVAAYSPRTAVPWEFFSLVKEQETLRLQVEPSILDEAPQLIHKPEQLLGDWEESIKAYWKEFETDFS